MFKKTFLWAFDLYKKRNMEQYYLQGRSWGRKGHDEDVVRAMNLVSDRHYVRCLDVGAGLGHYSEIAANICDDVVATDLSSTAIKQAQHRLHHVKNIQFEVKNLRDINASWGTFDLIILAEVLYYLGDQRFPAEFKELLKRITDLVQEKGRVLLVNYVSPGRNEKQLQSYVNEFIKTGLFLEKNETITTAGGKKFLAAVLRK